MVKPSDTALSEDEPQYPGHWTTGRGRFANVGDRRRHPQKVLVVIIVAGLCLVTAATTLVVTKRTPELDESSATLLAPPESGVPPGVAASGLLQQVPGFSVPSLTPNRHMLVSILKSRTMASAVVERFSFQQRYRAMYLEGPLSGFRARPRSWGQRKASA